MRKRVSIWYPRVERERTKDEPTEVEVDLQDVRAANSIVIDYDFERDGYRIRQATIFRWEMGDKVMDEGLVEVAFVPAWASGDPPND